MLEQPGDKPEVPDTPGEPHPDDDLDVWPLPDWTSPDDPLNKWVREQEEQRRKDQEAWTNAPYDAFLIPEDAPKTPLELGLRWGTDEWDEAQKRHDDYLKDFDRKREAANESSGPPPPNQPPMGPGQEEQPGLASSRHQQPE